MEKVRFIRDIPFAEGVYFFRDGEICSINEETDETFEVNGLFGPIAINKEDLGVDYILID